jgi:hypothetical protein
MPFSRRARVAHTTQDVSTELADEVPAIFSLITGLVLRWI